MPGRRILVVEDNPLNLKLVRDVLTAFEYEVVEAHTGEEGLELIRVHGPAAVVLDIRMPGLDGWQVLTRVRDDEATRAVPVIIVSILDEKSRGLTLGAADYLIKPVGREELVGALRRVGAVHSSTLQSGNGRGSTQTGGTG